MCLWVSGCGPIGASVVASQSTFEIRAGEPLFDDQPLAKGVVLIQTARGDSKSSCTGSLIAKRIVLTAAHCVTARKSRALVDRGIRVLFGVSPEKSERTNERSLTVERVVIHPKWRGIDRNERGPEQWVGQVDLALLYLGDAAPDLPLSDLLELGTDQAFDGGVIYLGYGPPDLKLDRLFHLRTGFSMVRSFESKLGQWNLAVDAFAPDKTREWPTPTVGDSGGPVLATKLNTKTGSFIQVGVLTTTESFTPIAPHRAWLKSHL